MKIRQDFVTNSSSVSYIVTFSPSLYESMDRFYWGGREDEKQVKRARIEELIKNDLLGSGTKVYWEGHELYVKKYEFATDEITTDDVFEYDGDEADFKAMSDEDLWDYIKGQFIMMSDLSRIYGFGVTQVETY